MYHCIKEEEFRQEFLGKSSYKFNSRYIGYRVLDRITVAQLPSTSLRLNINYGGQ